MLELGIGLGLGGGGLGLGHVNVRRRTRRGPLHMSGSSLRLSSGGPYTSKSLYGGGDGGRGRGRHIQRSS